MCIVDEERERGERKRGRLEGGRRRGREGGR